MIGEVPFKSRIVISVKEGDKLTKIAYKIAENIDDHILISPWDVINKFT
jgi:putative cell wall-binding protein